MANNSVAPRQKRRRVENALRNVDLVMEADLSMMAVDSFDGGDPLFAIEEENETQQQSDADLVFQVTDTTVRDEHFYLSDEKPIETSDDEYELPPTDDDGSNYLRNLFSESDEEQHQETDNDRDLPADPKSVNFKEKLCSWVVSHKVKQVAVDSLLTDVLPVLPDYSSLKLPKTCRTLIGTAKTTPLKQVEPGSYFHFGLARGIKKMIDRCGFKINESLHMELLGLVNTDGLPVAKAFGSQVWPIQCRFLNEETEHWPPIVIGVYHGNSKPTNTNEYLADFVTEALALEQTGFPYRSSNLKITVFGFSCDAPANSLAKYIKIHTGYGIMPKVTHCTDDENWGKLNSSKKVFVEKSLTHKGGFGSVDNVIERKENMYWKIEINNFQAWMLGFYKFVGEWKTTEIEKDKILIEYTYTLYSNNIFLYPINWIFTKTFWKKYMKQAMENVRQLAIDKEPYQYA